VTNKEQNPFEQLLRYWKLVRAYRWWICLGALVVTLAGFNLIAMIPNYYQATTTILVDPQQIPDRYVTSTVVEDPRYRLNTISQQVLSATRLQQIIDQYGLYPELRNKRSREEIIATMVKDVDIKVKEGGSSLSAFTITYRSTDRKAVALVTNQLAAGFIEWNLKNREQIVVDTTDFLRSELDRARQSLKDQESKLSQFKIAHAGEMPDDQAANLQMLSQLQSSLQANRETLNRLDMQRTMLLAGENSTSASGAPAAPVTERQQLLAEKRDIDRKLADLRKTYTSEFPDIVSLNKRLEQVNARLQQLPADKPQEIARSTDNVQLSLLDREISRLNDEQKQIKAQMNMYRSKMDAAPIRQQEMLDLSRNYQVSSNDYASLLEKTTASQLAAELEKRQKAERFTILDAATVPEHPFKPNRPLLMSVAFFGALCLSVLAAVAKDLLSRTVQGEQDLLKILPAGVPVLAVIPAIHSSTTLRRRRTLAITAAVLALVACGLEVVMLLRNTPPLG
jgi:polysaccharide chain length determinant protein (PEP-CTERM system associated)